MHPINIPASGIFQYLLKKDNFISPRRVAFMPENKCATFVGMYAISLLSMFADLLNLDFMID